MKCEEQKSNVPEKNHKVVILNLISRLIQKGYIYRDAISTEVFSALPGSETISEITINQCI